MFAHMFIGCNITSAIHNFCKTSVFKKLQNSAVLRDIADNLYKECKLSDETGNALYHFMK